MPKGSGRKASGKSVNWTPKAGMMVKTADGRQFPLPDARVEKIERMPGSKKQHMVSNTHLPSVMLFKNQIKPVNA